MCRSPSHSLVHDCSSSGARVNDRLPVATGRGVRVLAVPEAISPVRAQEELEVTFRPLKVTMGDEAAWFRLQGSLGGVTAPKTMHVIPPATSRGFTTSRRRPALRQNRRGAHGPTGQRRRRFLVSSSSGRGQLAALEGARLRRRPSAPLLRRKPERQVFL